MQLVEIDQAEFDAWIKDRPQVIQDLAAKWPPGRLYRHEKTGQFMQLYSYSENGTVTADVLLGYRQIDLISMRVFGIDPNDLEESDETPKYEVEVVEVAGPGVGIKITVRPRTFN